MTANKGHHLHDILDPISKIISSSLHTVVSQYQARCLYRTCICINSSCCSLRLTQVTSFRSQRRNRTHDLASHLISAQSCCTFVARLFSIHLIVECSAFAGPAEMLDSPPFTVHKPGLVFGLATTFCPAAFAFRYSSGTLGTRGD